MPYDISYLAVSGRMRGEPSWRSFQRHLAGDRGEPAAVEPEPDDRDG